MDLQLPHPIETYLRAENAGDVEALSECFTPYATVRDEGHLYEGLPAIKNWKTQIEEENTTTRSRLWRSALSNGIATLKARLSGTFPGSPVTVKFHFELVDDQIASLQIRS